MFPFCFRAFWLIVISSFSFSLLAQEASFQEMNIYQIQLGAFSKKPDLQNFKDLKDLGTLSFTSISDEPKSDGVYRVFLGKFLGLETAEKVMELVKARGYTDAVYDVDGFNLNHSTGKLLNYTLQLGANKKGYDVMRFGDNVDYVLYQKGFYRICMGLYERDNIKSIRKQVLPGLKRKGIKPYFRKFR